MWDFLESARIEREIADRARVAGKENRGWDAEEEEKEMALRKRKRSPSTIEEGGGVGENEAKERDKSPRKKKGSGSGKGKGKGKGKSSKKSETFAPTGETDDTRDGNSSGGGRSMERRTSDDKSTESIEGRSAEVSLSKSKSSRESIIDAGSQEAEINSSIESDQNPTKDEIVLVNTIGSQNSDTTSQCPEAVVAPDSKNSRATESTESTESPTLPDVEGKTENEGDEDDNAPDHERNDGGGCVKNKLSSSFMLDEASSYSRLEGDRNKSLTSPPRSAVKLKSVVAKSSISKEEVVDKIEDDEEKKFVGIIESDDEDDEDSFKKGELRSVIERPRNYSGENSKNRRRSESALKTKKSKKENRKRDLEREGGSGPIERKRRCEDVKNKRSK